MGLVHPRGPTINLYFYCGRLQAVPIPYWKLSYYVDKEIQYHLELGELYPEHYDEKVDIFREK